jgi:hypothetical protein
LRGRLVVAAERLHTQEDQQADQDERDQTATDEQRHLVLWQAALTGATGTTLTGLPRLLATLLRVPATLSLPLALLAPGLLRIATLLRVLLAPTGLSRLLRLSLTGIGLTGLLLAPATAALLRRLALTWLRLGRRLTRLLAAGALTPATATLSRLLSPAALARLASRLSPLPARLAPRLPRTPRSLWRRSHMRSLETHV